MKKGIQTKSDKGMDEVIVLIRGQGRWPVESPIGFIDPISTFACLRSPIPLPVRREVSFCEAIYEGEKEVEGVRAKFISRPEEIHSLWQEEKIPVLVDPDGEKTRRFIKPDVLVDAIMAKKDLGTHIKKAPWSLVSARVSVPKRMSISSSKRIGDMTWAG